jgi:hypothetical protein
VYWYESPVTLSSLTLQGGGNDIGFDRLKGTTANGGTIVLMASPFSKTISITGTGSIQRN